MPKGSRPSPGIDGGREWVPQTWDAGHLSPLLPMAPDPKPVVQQRGNSLEVGMALGAPRMMANLTLASAKHLHSQGHISAAHHLRIKRAVSAPKAPMVSATAGPFGSLAPGGAGHYMSTPTPVGTDEGGGL